MKRMILLAALLGAVLGVRPLSHTFAASAASDAAHRCQQGGYATLVGSDGTTFQNAGQCISYVAQGGTIQGVPACTVVAGASGCVTLDNLSIPNFQNAALGTITLSGIFSFSPTGSGCGYPCGGAASGGGAYTLSAGSTFNGGATSGAFTVTGTTGTSYYYTGSTCATTSVAIIHVAVTFTAGGQSINEELDFLFGTTLGELAAVYDPTTRSYLQTWVS